jgi:hypothetical protein
MTKPMTKRAHMGLGTAVLLLVPVFILSACDGGDGITRADYVRRANAVCRDGAKQVAVLQIPGRADVASMPRAAAEVVAVQRRSLARLKRIRPPKEARAEITKWIALVDQTIDQAEVSAESQRDGDISRALTANVNGTSLDQRADELAESLGLESCVQTATPPLPPASTTTSTSRPGA